MVLFLFTFDDNVKFKKKKPADLWGFRGIRESIRNLTNCTMYDSPLEGHSKVSNLCLTTLFYRAFA